MTEPTHARTPVWITALILLLLGANLALSAWLVSQRKEPPVAERAPLSLDPLNARFDRLDTKLTELAAKKPEGVTDKLLGSLQDNVLKSLAPGKEPEKQPKPTVKFTFSSIAVLPFFVRPKGAHLGEEAIKIKRFEREIAAASGGLATLLESDQRYRVVLPDKTGLEVKEENFVELGGKLGTEAFVVGEAARYTKYSGSLTLNGIELHVALIEARSGFPVWSSKYDLDGGVPSGSTQGQPFDDAVVRKNLGPAIVKMADELLSFAKAAKAAPDAKDTPGKK